MSFDPTNFKILIVDDIPKNIQVVSNILKSEGYQMTFARSGKSALEKLGQIDFDLVLLDIMMPEMDGFETCNEIKSSEKTKDLPVIFLTAKSDANSIVKGLEIGAVDYINKPFHHAELKARVKTHLQVKQMRENLAEVNATKDKFFSIIAHDLRNPFNHLLGFSELLIDRFDTLDDHRKQEFIGNIYSSLQHMFRLLENLLSWSRLQLGTIEWDPSPIELSSLVKETMELLENQAGSKQINLESRHSEKLMVFGDPNMLETVLRNLISNALKFTKEKGTVWVDAEVSEGIATIAVNDTGIGMPPDIVAELFRIDATFSQPGTNEERGTGLGLILCKEFVEKNGGEIWVESVENKGSKFSFTIPLHFQ